MRTGWWGRRSCSPCSRSRALRSPPRSRWSRSPASTCATFRSWMVAIGAIVATLSVAIATVFLYAPLHHRFFHGDTAQVGGISINVTGRDTLWAANWDYFLKAPVIGHGAGAADRLTSALPEHGGAAHPHNDYLRILVDYGIVGLVLWFFAYFALLRADLAAVAGGARVGDDGRAHPRRRRARPDRHRPHDDRRQPAHRARPDGAARGSCSACRSGCRRRRRRRPSERLRPLVAAPAARGQPRPRRERPRPALPLLDRAVLGREPGGRRRGGAAARARPRRAPVVADPPADTRLRAGCAGSAGGVVTGLGGPCADTGRRAAARRDPRPQPLPDALARGAAYGGRPGRDDAAQLPPDVPAGDVPARRPHLRGLPRPRAVAGRRAPLLPRVGGGERVARDVRSRCTGGRARSGASPASWP